MSIQVNDFRWEPGKNDAEYIKLLESSRDEWQKIAQKAIAKLKALSKAQQPRVLTLEEVSQDFKIWSLGKQEIEIWWIETKNAKKTIPASTTFLNFDEAVILRTHFGEIGYPYATYNKYWRCWSARPTEEQRKEVSWNE